MKRHRATLPLPPPGRPKPGLDLVKRALDVTVAAVALLVGSPLLLAVATVVLVTMGRPILFRQVRPGRHGRPFPIVKFRTMRPPGPAHRRHPGVPAADAGRLTPAGRWLRATSLDELPTLWNVLRGDMSLVGPRPLLAEYLDRYTPQQARRHEVRPGITGLAQIRGRNALSWDEKLSHDVFYVEHRTLRLDLMILALTVQRVLRRDGVIAPDCPTSHEFDRPAGASGVGAAARAVGPRGDVSA